MIIMVNNMASRMEKYHGNEFSNDTLPSRSSRNSSLYKTMYDDEGYSNIEGVLTTPKNNEINIDKVREILMERENREKEKEHIVKDVKIEIPEMASLDDEKSYDIVDILKQAKEESKENKIDDSKHYRLKDEYIEELKNPRKKNIEASIEEDLNDIKELLNTITKSNDLSKLKDADLSLDMLSDLKTNTTLKKDALMKSLLTEKETEEENKEKELDNTFNTKSLKLNTKDFGEEEETKSPLFTITMVLLFVLLISAIIFVCYLLLK